MPEPNKHSGRAYLWALLVLTLLAGVFRFAYIEKPPLWGDEAMTYSRVNGTYREMLQILRDDGFAPLHYEYYWALARWVNLTPFWMRLLPALAGTLMVPAVYLLARQLASRKTALLAAAFACCSAYLLAYSRDAKMYMHLWLFCTLHLALGMMWLRTRARLAYWGWIAAGLAAVGTHAPALLLVAVEPLFLITAGRAHWKTAVFFVFGVTIILAGPAGYYLKFNQWHEKSGGLTPGVELISATQQAGEAKPVVEQPAPERREGRDGRRWQRPRGPRWSASGINWIQNTNQGQTGPGYVRYSATSYLFNFEWPRPREDRFYGRHLTPPAIMSAATVTIAIMAGLFGLAALPWARHSTPSPGTPGEGWGEGDSVFRVASNCKYTLTPALSRSTGRGGRDDAPEPWWRRLLWLAALIVLPTYGLFYCRSVQDPTSPVDWFHSINALVGRHWVIALAEMVVVAVALAWWPRVAVGLAVAAPAFLVGALNVLMLTRASMTEAWAAWIEVARHPYVLGALVLLLPPVAFHFAGATTRERLVKLGQLAFVAAVILGACYGLWAMWDHLRALAEKSGEDWQSVWHPRYLGIIVGPLCVAVAVLLLRLPTRPLRWGAVAFVLGVNLVNGYARLFVPNEPPVDKMAADVLLAQDDASPVRTFFNYTQGGSPPSTGGMFGHPATYYLCMLTEKKPAPIPFRTGKVREEFRFAPYVDPARVAQDVQAASHVTRAIVWEHFDAQSPSARSTDATLERLGTGWTLCSTQVHPIRVSWNWIELGCLERREYTRATARP